MIKEEAISLFGNGARLARALGIARANITHWHDGAPIPEKHSRRIKMEMLNREGKLKASIRLTLDPKNVEQV